MAAAAQGSQGPSRPSTAPTCACPTVTFWAATRTSSRSTSTRPTRTSPSAPLTTAGPRAWASSAPPTAAPTWTSRDAPCASACCDPAVAYAYDGTVYVGMLDTSPAAEYVIKLDRQRRYLGRARLRVAMPDRNNLAVDNGATARAAAPSTPPTATCRPPTASRATSPPTAALPGAPRSSSASGSGRRLRAVEPAPGGLRRHALCRLPAVHQLQRRLLGGRAERARQVHRRRRDLHLDRAAHHTGRRLQLAQAGRGIFCITRRQLVVPLAQLTPSSASARPTRSMST